MEQKVREFLRSRINRGIYSGAAVIFGNPSGKFFSVYEGNLKDNSDISVGESTVFDLQSITKALSTSVLSLVVSKNGLINLDEVIDDYIPAGAPRFLAGKGITFKHLLTHSSGLSDSSLEGSFKTAFDIWKHMFSAPLNFKPGSSIEYSDLGYRILGKLIESCTKESLESLFGRLVVQNARVFDISYIPNNPFNVAGTPDAHGIIDDEQVHALGGILGCDGLFGSANSIFLLITELLKAENKIVPNFTDLLSANTVFNSSGVNSFYESLACGSKTFGWEINSASTSYAGKFHKSSCFEKAGGAGTFIWFDSQTKQVFVYLTNHGKPKPFNEQSWIGLIDEVAPHKLSDLIYELLE